MTTASEEYPSFGSILQQFNRVMNGGAGARVGGLRACGLCHSQDDQLKVCSRCRKAWYCSPHHQRLHWKQHKPFCGPDQGQGRGAADNKRGKHQASKTKFGFDESLLASLSGGVGGRGCESDVAPHLQGGGGGRGRRRSPPVPDLSTPIDASSTLEPPHAQRSRIQPLYDVQECSQSLEEGGFTQDWFSNIMQPVMRDLNAYGVCVVDEFLGAERAEQILNEVKVLHSRGVFEDGQVVSRQVQDRARGMIRGDKIAWVTGGEPQCGGVGQLMRVVDTVVSKCNQHADAGKLANYNITWRTRAMVACYPGRDTQYVKHVDNPNGDGRCITAIYYLNQGWTEKDGGVLRIYPEGCSDKIAAIEPKFDRMLFFWSDRRNPHEVLPSKFTRYAITVWYLDQKEREEFLARQCLANVPHTPPHPSSDPQ